MITHQAIAATFSTRLSAVAAIFLAVIFVLLAGTATAQPAGNIQFVSGGVEIERGDQKFPAMRATLVNVGDLIRTSPNGNIQMNMIDGAFLSLRPGSEMRVEKYEFSPTQTTVGDAVIGLLKGTLRTFTGEIVSRNRDRFKMRTAVATLGIRGSGNVLAHYDAIGTINHTLTGAHSVTSNAGGTLVSMPGQTIQVLAGQAPRYIPTPAFIAQAASPAPKSSSSSGETEKAAEPTATPPANTTSAATAAPPPPSTTSAAQANTAATAAIVAATTTLTGGVFTVRGIDASLPAGNQGVFVQTGATGNTTAILNAAGQLIELRNGDISVNMYGNAAFPAGYTPSGSPDATVSFSGGSHRDGFKTPDGSVIIGRWTGGNISLLNNTLAPTDPNYRFDSQLGNRSLSYGLVTPTLASVASTFTGSSTYNLLAATAPTDAVGNVGTLSSATIGVNFSLLTARLNAALAVNNQNLTLSGNSSFARGSSLLQWTSGSGTLNIGCSGSNCAGIGYNGSVGANIAGATGSFIGGQYRINPIRIAGSALADLITGHFVLQTSTNPVAGGSISDPNAVPAMRSSNPLSTGGYEGIFPQGGTAVFNAAGQMIGARNGTFTAFISSGGVGGIVPAGYIGVTANDASYELIGGQHRDAFRTSDGSVILGRWEGGAIEVRDNGQPNSAARVYNLGARSAAYGVFRYTDSAIASTFTGTTTYSLIGSTLPTDGAGNVGRLNSWTVGFNFNSLTATLNGSLSINNQNLTIVGQPTPFQQGSPFVNWVSLDPNNPSTLAANTMAITCSGSNCSSRGYVGVTSTGLAGATGQFAAGQYRITPTGVQGSGGAMPDHISGFFALQAATAPTVGISVPQTGTATLSFGSLSNVTAGFNTNNNTNYLPNAISGTVNANFSNRTVGFNATVSSTTTPGGAAGPTFTASASNLPLVGVGFSAATGTGLPTNVGALTVTCSGACAGVQPVGRFDGFFTGNTGTAGRAFFTLGSLNGDGMAGIAAFGTPGAPVAPVAPLAFIAQDAGRGARAVDAANYLPAGAFGNRLLADPRRRNAPAIYH